MTEDDARKIERAAIVMLHWVRSQGFMNTEVHAAIRHLPLHEDDTLELTTARWLLESTQAWKETEEKGGA